MDVVGLCKKYQQEGVVAMDLAGDESLNCEANPDHRKAYEVSVLTQPTDSRTVMRMIKKALALVCFIYFNHSLTRLIHRNNLYTSSIKK